MQYLVCFDMDRVLVDHMSTWQYVYDRLEISNEEAFNLYNQGKLDEWDWLKMDLAMIKEAYPAITDQKNEGIVPRDSANAGDERVSSMDSRWRS